MRVFRKLQVVTLNIIKNDHKAQDSSLPYSDFYGAIHLSINKTENPHKPELQTTELRTTEVKTSQREPLELQSSRLKNPAPTNHKVQTSEVSTSQQQTNEPQTSHIRNS